MLQQHAWTTNAHNRESLILLLKFCSLQMEHKSKSKNIILTRPRQFSILNQEGIGQPQGYIKI